MKALLIHIIILVLFSTNIHSQKEGKILLQHYTTGENDSSKGMLININIWYNNHISIQEIPYIKVLNDSLGTKRSIDIKYYLFIDSKLNRYRYYSSFSDTASIIYSSNNNSVFEKYGGWNMYSKNKVQYDKCIILTDSIVNGLKLGRHKYLNENNGVKSSFILYFLYDTNDTPINYLKYFADKIGKNIIRMDTFYGDKLTGIHKISYHSDTLSKYEKRIFQKWSGNE